MVVLQSAMWLTDILNPKSGPIPKYRQRGETHQFVLLAMYLRPPCLFSLFLQDMLRQDARHSGGAAFMFPPGASGAKFHQTFPAVLLVFVVVVVGSARILLSAYEHLGTTK